jgi:hypothetical protein
MKLPGLLKFAMLTAFMFSFQKFFAQDTIYMRGGSVLSAKVIEIGELEVKYKMFIYHDGPTMSVFRNKITKIKFQNGTEMKFTDDELDVNIEKDILDKKIVYKFHPFGLVNGHLQLGYERVIHTGFNIDSKVGYIFSSNINFNDNKNNQRGFFLKPGVKFLLGSDIVVNGMKYAHPLKGKYIKVEMFFTHIHYNEANLYREQTITNSYGYSYVTNVYEVKPVNLNAIGGNIIYGRQYTLGNVMTLDYYVGIGVGRKSLKAKDVSAGYKIDERSGQYNMIHTNALTNNNMTFTWGLSLGIISKK